MLPVTQLTGAAAIGGCWRGQAACPGVSLALWRAGFEPLPLLLGKVPGAAKARQWQGRKYASQPASEWWWVGNSALPFQDAQLPSWPGQLRAGGGGGKLPPLAWRWPSVRHDQTRPSIRPSFYSVPLPVGSLCQILDCNLLGEGTCLALCPL